MDDLADRLEAAADVLTTVERGLAGLAVPVSAFGALPRLAAELHTHWQAVLSARAREAADAAARLYALAGTVQDVSRQYDETDVAVAARVAASDTRWSA